MDAGSMLAAAAQIPVTPPAEGTVQYACREENSSFCHWAWDLTSNTDIASTLDVPHTSQWPGKLASLLFIWFMAWITMRLVRRLIKRTVIGLQGEVVQRRLGNIRRRTPRAFLNTGQHLTLRRAQRAETMGALLRSASTVIIVIFALLAVLKVMSFNLGPFVAGTAVATAALGFGAQNIVRDFLAGFFIVVEDQYGVGDVIDVGSANGTVESVSLRITRVRNSDGTLWHIPNGEIKKVGNKSQTWSRAVVEFRVNLNTDIAQAIHLIKREADDMWRDSAYAGIIIDEPEIWAPEAVDAEGIELKLAVKVRPLEQWQVSRTLRSRVKSAFDEAGIRIASGLADAYGPAATTPDATETTGTGSGSTPPKA